MSKWQLFSLLAQRSSKRSTIRATSGDISGYVQAIEREDGSGSSFNVRVDTGEIIATVHVRTID